MLSGICIGLLWSAFGRVPIGNHKVKIHLCRDYISLNLIITVAWHVLQCLLALYSCNHVKGPNLDSLLQGSFLLVTLVFQFHEFMICIGLMFVIFTCLSKEAYM